MAKGVKREVSPEDKKPVTRQSLFRVAKIFQFLKPYKALFFTGMVFLLLSGLTSMTFPFIAGQLVDSFQNTFKN